MKENLDYRVHGELARRMVDLDQFDGIGLVLRALKWGSPSTKRA